MPLGHHSDHRRMSLGKKTGDGGNSEGDDETVVEPEQGNVLSHIISQLRPGADLSKVTLPTFILEPKSIFMAHPETLLPMTKIEDPVERFLSVVKFYLSGWHIKPPSVLLTGIKTGKKEVLFDATHARHTAPIVRPLEEQDEPPILKGQSTSQDLHAGPPQQPQSSAHNQTQRQQQPQPQQPQPQQAQPQQQPPQASQIPVGHGDLIDFGQTNSMPVPSIPPRNSSLQQTVQEPMNLPPGLQDPMQPGQPLKRVDTLTKDVDEFVDAQAP
ncbi:hypothetical protein P7C71_g4842, partial [Lecanoromycetidae sp. Uapishka_2]